MDFNSFDPLIDPRWDDFVKSHPQASVFHQTGWLRSLAKTYDYRPLVLTSASGGKPLSDGLVLCAVRSWITGARLISLPFADHTEPLLDGIADQLPLTEWMQGACRHNSWGYIELRPITWAPDHMAPFALCNSFWLHTLDLSPSLETLRRGLHKNCMLRRIRHAERQRLAYERGSSDGMLDAFYRLLVMTRRRHGLLPQPRVWFDNLKTEIGLAPEIRLVRKNNIAIAGIFSLRHRETVVYKYGCSDERFHSFAGMPLLFWKLIEESRSEGAAKIDLGRTDLENEGLIEFKNRLGATRQKITYLRYPHREGRNLMQLSHSAVPKRIVSYIPNALSSKMGQVVYRHLA